MSGKLWFGHQPREAAKALIRKLGDLKFDPVIVLDGARPMPRCQARKVDGIVPVAFGI